MGQLVAAALSGLLLVLPALWNGFPLLQYDTGGYLARWYEGTLVPSRPGAYGLLLAVAAPFDFWPVAAGQAAAAVWILHLMLRTHGLGGRPMLMLGLSGLLAITTALPWLASLLLTDIFAGLAVLALSLLVLRGETIGRTERCGLVALVAFAAATHGATFLLLAGLTVTAGFAYLLRRAAVSRSGLARGVTALAVGLALTLAANFAVSGRLAWTPGGAALAFGRMLQDGIVARYLDEHCARARLRLCLYKDELPRDADEWFWGSDLFDELGRFAGLNREMETIVFASLEDYPWMQTKAAARAFARQLVAVGTGEGVVNWIWHTYAIIEKFTPGAAPAMRAARQQTSGFYFWETINRLHVPVALAAMLLLPILLTVGRLRKPLADIGALAATTSLAIVGNAAICGILSNPHDRYGARIAWLAVLTVAIAAARVAFAAAPPSSTRASAQRASSRIA